MKKEDIDTIVDWMQLCDLDCTLRMLIVVTFHKVTIVHNISWISTHAYCVIECYQQPILILERLVEGASIAKVVIYNDQLWRGGATRIT
jgi:hypothetical protein